MKRFPLVLLICILFSAFPAAVSAQNQNPPVDSQSAWGEVINPDGSIRYNNMIDLGVETQAADWMPQVGFFGMSVGLKAEYHRYQTPSGNVIVTPTASTLFFMALNPQESGLFDADSQLNLGFGQQLELPGLLKGILEGYIDPSSFQAENVPADEFYQDVIDNKRDIWAWPGLDTVRFLWSLYQPSRADQSIYTTLLLYTPGSCSNVPGGCPTLPGGGGGSGGGGSGGGGETPPTNSCTTPVTTGGAVTAIGQLLAPPYPLVVGQDPDRRGVDLAWILRVEPTSYTYGVEIPIYETRCIALEPGEVSNCAYSSEKAGIYKQVLVRTDCQTTTTYYNESLNWVMTIASLSNASRDWILNGELQIRYPGAYLHHPYFSFLGNPASGSFQGNTFVWSMTQNGVQTADPGYFDLKINGATSGTPVSAGRGFSLPAGQFGVWLKEVVIIK